VLVERDADPEVAVIFSSPVKAVCVGRGVIVGRTAAGGIGLVVNPHAVISEIKANKTLILTNGLNIRLPF